MPKPLSTEQATRTRAGDLIASAVRTLEAEASGITTLSAAIHDGLGRAFIAAVDLISAARGRLIVTGMGNSGHVGRKIAATFASTGTPAFFVHPSEASHGDLGMITPDDAIMALSWSGETAELKDLIVMRAASKSGSSRSPPSSTARSGAPPMWCWRCRRRARPVRTISPPPPRP
jgi:arabinose-5-phosphate isomerase